MLVVACAVWFYAQRAVIDAAAPSSPQFDAAERLLTAEVKPGDAFAMLPSWGVGQTWRFRRVWRNKGLQFDKAMLFGEPVSAWDTDGFERLWVLSTHEYGARLQADTLGKVVAHHSLSDGTALTLIDLPAARTVYDFRTRLSDATVTRVDTKGKVEKCRSTRDSQRCSGASWRNITAGVNEVGGTRRRCISAQPHPAKGELRLHFGELPAASELRGYFGNRLWAVRYDEGSDVVLRVLVDGKQRHKMTLGRGDFSWHPFVLPIGKELAAKPVTFVLSATDTTWRQVCLDARLLGPTQRDQ